MTASLITTNCSARALRVALWIGTNPVEDDFDELYARITELMDAYVRSPEGTNPDGIEAPASMLMARLAACISDVIPLEERERLSRPPAN